jgi:hypothetical protein
LDDIISGLLFQQRPNTHTLASPEARPDIALAVLFVVLSSGLRAGPYANQPSESTPPGQKATGERFNASRFYTNRYGMQHAKRLPSPSMRFCIPHMVAHQ